MSEVERVDELSGRLTIVFTGIVPEKLAMLKGMSKSDEDTILVENGHLSMAPQGYLRLMVKGVDRPVMFKHELVLRVENGKGNHWQNKSRIQPPLPRIRIYESRTG